MDILKSLFTIFNKKLDYNIAQNECLLTHLKAAIVHQRNFSEFCQCHKGKKIALIACGPTLKYAKYLDEMIYVGVNGAYRQSKVKLNYIFVQDNVPWIKEVNNYLPQYCQKFYGIIPQERCRNNNSLLPISIFDIKESNAKEYYLEDLLFHNWPNNIAIEPFRDHCGAVFSAMQFILYTNPKNIFLFGCDCTNGSHFYDENSNYSHSYLYQIKSWKSLKQYTDKYFSETKIYCVNPISLKGIFIDIYTQDFLKSNNQDADNSTLVL